MKILSSKMHEHLSSEITTLATCWHLKLKSGEELGFTDFDADLAIDGITYHASKGFIPSAVLNNSGLAIDNLEIEGILDNEEILESEILAGKFDHAELKVFLVNYNELAAGKIHLKRGWLGEVTLKQSMFVVEVKGLTQALNQNLGELYSPKCRAKFGDSKCKVDLTQYTYSGEISSIISKSNMIVKLKNSYLKQESIGVTNELKTDFKYGNIKFLQGSVQGIEREIRSYIDGEINLTYPLPHLPKIGEKCQIVAGCDKCFNTCVAKYNNAINFRGEPHIPGSAKLLKVN